MAAPSRRIYNRNASAHISVSSPTSPPSSPLSSATFATAAPLSASASASTGNRKPAQLSPHQPSQQQQQQHLLPLPHPSSTPPSTLPPPVSVGAKKKKKKRSKAKSECQRTYPPPTLADDDGIDYSRKAYFDGGGDLTDDEMPNLVDIDGAPSTSSLPSFASPPMTADSSASSKPPMTTGPPTKSKKKKKKGRQAAAGKENDPTTSDQPSDLGTNQQPQPQPQPQQKIWNTTTAEEKERIKEFWLGLSEQERRNLVRIEKENVSKRVKEGSKILNCSCHVCGRKQVAIEEELDVLYDAYYEELENGASPPRNIQFGPEPPPNLYEDEDDDEDFEDDDEYDESQDTDDHYHHHHHHHYHHHHHHGLPGEYIDSRREIFNFGASLKAKGGVLTIADDLLQNQGRQFIDMMEKIADMRFRKEEEAKKEVAEAGGPYDDDYDDENDEYYEDEDPEDSEEDVVCLPSSDSSLTRIQDPQVAERKRVEEGRRMFHIFAARMFEQRVLAAYREKVAQERQARLLEEIEEEDRRAEERSSKKAKEKERKKERQRVQKQQKEEERIKKENERAAEEAARRAEEEKRAEEQRKKKEEARVKREAERKQQELERLRKEEERRKRQAEERERQQEVERKRREKDDAAKKRREENLRKEREAKELKEREAKERKDREEKEKLQKTAAAKGISKRQTAPPSPSRLAASQPAVPKVPTPTPSRSSLPPLTTTPPYPPFANGSSSSTPGTSNHTPSPRGASILPPQLHASQSLPTPSHFHGPIQPLPSSGFSSPSLRGQFVSIPESIGPGIHPPVIGAGPVQPGRPASGVPPMVNGLPLGMYPPLPVGNPNQYGRYPSGANPQGGFSPGGPHTLPLSIGRAFGDAVAPVTPTYPSPIGSMPSHGSPILPPPPKPVVDSGMSSPQVSHSRKTSIDALTDLTASLTTRHTLPPGINGSGPLTNPPGLSRTIQRPAPIQRPHSTASSGQGGWLVQDEEMGVGSKALLNEGLEGEDEIIEPTSGRGPFNPSSVRDKVWSAAPGLTDPLWGQEKAPFLWGSAQPSSTAEENPFPLWDSRPPAFPLHDRVRDVVNRIDPQGYVPVDTVVSHLQRQYPLERCTAEDVLHTAQTSHSSLLVMAKNGKWLVRTINPSETRAVVGARLMTTLAPTPGALPNDAGRNILGSLAEVVRGGGGGGTFE